MLVAQKVTAGVYKGVTTSELDELAAETAASMTTNHPDYAVVRALLHARGVSWPVADVSRRDRAPAAGGAHRCVEPAQEHAQVLLRHVRAPWFALKVEFPSC